VTLGERQELFSRLIAKLITKMYDMGYQVRCGDFYAKRRDPLEHKLTSLHYSKCAADLNLFQNGKFLDKTSDHDAFGEYWESLSPYCTWGGRWSDGNHYQVSVDPRPGFVAAGPPKAEQNPPSPNPPIA
jgi:hypothetical protein